MGDPFRKTTPEAAGQVLQAGGMQAQAIPLDHGGHVVVFAHKLGPLEIPTPENAGAVELQPGSMVLVLDPETARAVRATLPQPKRGVPGAIFPK